MKYAGGLLLVNVLLIAAYFLFATEVGGKRVLTFASVGLAVGVFLMVCDRVTGIKIPGLADMTTVVEKAKADADAIAAMKKRIESQSATVDLVAESLGGETVGEAEAVDPRRFEQRLVAADHFDQPAAAQEAVAVLRVVAAAVGGIDQRIVPVGLGLARQAFDRGPELRSGVGFLCRRGRRHQQQNY